MNKKIILTLFFSIIIFLIFSAFCVVFFLYSFQSTPEGIVPKKTSYRYKFSRYDSSLNRLPETGIVTRPEKLPEGFLTYEDSKGVTTLISEFLLTDFQCHGKCSCASSPDSRRAALVPGVIKTAGILMATTSLAAANFWAGNYYRSLCKEELEGKCPPEDIESKVEECKSIEPIVIDTVLPGQYYCHGDCFPNTKPITQRKDFTTSQINTLLQMVEEKDCEYEMFSEDIFIPREAYADGQSGMTVPIFEDLAFAEKYFLENDLSAFCEEMGKAIPKEFEGEVFNLCSPRNDKGVNPTVDCIRLYHDGTPKKKDDGKYDD